MAVVIVTLFSNRECAGMDCEPTLTPAAVPTMQRRSMRATFDMNAQCVSAMA